MKSRVREGGLVIDDPNTLELEELIENYDIDLIMGGVKEKYLVHKLGIPCLLIHSYENGPYMGFEGFLNLARDMYAAIYNPVWNLVEFQETEDPDLEEEVEE
jgi:nitrogenase molybdenum-iron protein alpha chain